MRADAVRNRRRIFDEAQRAIAAGEITLTLNELARRSDVGVGTVYRLFPTQRAMLEAVLEAPVRVLIAAATDAERRPEPVQALVDVLHAALLAALAQPGLIDILITAADETDSFARRRPNWPQPPPACWTASARLPSSPARTC